MSFHELVQMNGAAGTHPTIASQYVSKATWYPWSHLGVAAASHDKREVEFLAVLDARQFTTQPGIRIKSTRRRVQAVYGEPEIESDISAGGKIVTALIYDKIGFAVFLDQNVAQMILIFRPGDGGSLASLCGG